MFDEIDEVLRQLMIRELPIKNNEVDIAFNQPKKEWSARISRPTLNFYLYDVRENNKLRQQSPYIMTEPNGQKKNSVLQRRGPIRLDLHYMVTAWATEPDDEHRLLARTIMVLYRAPEIPQDLLSDALKELDVPISIKAAQYENLEKPSDLWSVMDNQMKPSIPCVVTMAVNPFTQYVTPLVQTTQVKVGPDMTYWIKGAVTSKKLLQNLRVILVERGVDALVQANGEFALQNLQAGTYTIEAQAEGLKPARRSITVPSQDYDIKM